jgi:hypothetical protein
MSGKNVCELLVSSPFVPFNESFRPVSPFPQVAPSDCGSPPTSGTMRTLRRLSSRFGFLRLSLVSRYLAVPLFFCASGVAGERHPLRLGEMSLPALSQDVTGCFNEGWTDLPGS